MLDEVNKTLAPLVEPAFGPVKSLRTDSGDDSQLTAPDDEVDVTVASATVGEVLSGGFLTKALRARRGPMSD
jgi:hypothetical protein